MQVQWCRRESNWCNHSQIRWTCPQEQECEGKIRADTCKEHKINAQSRRLQFFQYNPWNGAYFHTFRWSNALKSAARSLVLFPSALLIHVKLHFRQQPDCRLKLLVIFKGRPIICNKGKKSRKPWFHIKGYRLVCGMRYLKKWTAISESTWINPDVEIFVELRQEKGYVFTDSLKRRGAASGTQGKMVALVSGGIDSPVAAWLMMKRGCDIVHCIWIMNLFRWDHAWEGNELYRCSPEMVTA